MTLGNFLVSLSLIFLSENAEDDFHLTGLFTETLSQLSTYTVVGEWLVFAVIPADYVVILAALCQVLIKCSYDV